MQTAIFVLGWIISIVACVSVLSERRAPGATAAWLIFLLVLPWISAVIYVIVGTRKLHQEGSRKSRLRHADHITVPVEQALPVDQLLRRLGIPGATRGNQVDLLVEARASRLALIDTIEKAEHDLFLLIYLFECDPSGLAVMSALIDAAKRGVRVRMMVDDLGSSNILRDQVDALHDAGGQLVRIRPLWFALLKRAANLRNHRKIVVADGRRAWTGGRNISDVYLADFSEQKRWLDLSLRIEGPAVRVLEEVCRSDWRYATAEDVPARTQACDQCTDGISVQVVASGPDQRDDVWHMALIKACFEAETRIWIATPYCVPDDSTMNALLTAARSGIDVRVFVPRRSDHRIVDFVGRSYQREMQRNGIKVLRFEGGMLHSKAVLIDSDIAIVGSANLDARSLFLNYETMTIVHESAFATQLEQYFRFIETRSSSGLRPVNLTLEILGNFARIFSPML